MVAALRISIEIDQNQTNLTTSEYNITVNTHADALYGYALKLSGNQMDAEDIVQHTFERVWLKREKIDFETAKSLMYRIAYNFVVDNYRKDKNRKERESNYQVEEAYKDQGLEAKDILEKAFTALSEEQKTLIMMRDYEGYAYEEIAEIMEINLSQVKVYLFRARKKMQQAIRSLELSHS